MDYADIYLRHRRKDDSSANHLAKSIDIETPGEQRVERVLKGAFSLQELVDRIDALSARVNTFDEKMVNLTKLVKLAQGLQEEKEGELRRQQHELRSRLKRQEQITARLQEDLDVLRGGVPVSIRDALIAFQRDGENENSKIQKQNELQLTLIKKEMEDSFNTLRRDVEQRTTTLQRDVCSSVSSQMDGPSGVRERLSLIEGSVRALEVTNQGSRLRSIDDEMKQLYETLGSLRQQADATSNSLNQLEKERQKSQEAIIEEVESTREWATRNLQRVKQHMESLSSGVSQLQKDQIDISTRLSRVSCQADVEYKKLRALLLQKVREADTLCTLVEKEFHKVEDVAERHQGLRNETNSLRDMAF